MSEADKMFEELGYEKINDPCLHGYTKIEDGFADSIYFDKEVKNIAFNSVDIANEYEGDIFILTHSTLKAINKKVEELGWLENG